MEINLNEIEAITLYLHLSEWLDDNEDFQDSNDIRLSGKWSTLEHIYNKIKSKF